MLSCSLVLSGKNEIPMLMLLTISYHKSLNILASYAVFIGVLVSSNRYNAECYNVNRVTIKYNYRQVHLQGDCAHDRSRSPFLEMRINLKIFKTDNIMSVSSTFSSYEQVHVLYNVLVSTSPFSHARKCNVRVLGVLGQVIRTGTLCMIANLVKQQRAVMREM